MTKLVLSLCDRTGNMLKPWAKAGYSCLAVDIQHSKEPRTIQYGEGDITYVWGDVRTYLPPLAQYRMCFAFPPCTHVAVSGARWFKDKGLAALHEAIGLVEACRRIAEWTGAPYLIENPVSTLSTYWRKPDYIFDPCDYGGYEGGEEDDYTKKTCLWTGNGFVMPEPKRIEPKRGSLIHRMAPSADRGDLRSITPMGFAQAVFEANYTKSENLKIA